MKHHIIVKWNEQVTDKKEILKDIETIFNKTLLIDGITKVDLIPNVIDRPNRYDLMIVITMTKEALPVYDSSECHKEWKNKYSCLIESKCIFDCE